MKDMFYFKYPRTLEEKRTIKVGICCFILLEFGVLFTAINNHSYFTIYLPLLSIIALAFLFILASIRIYELCIYFSAEYVLYIVQEEDTLLKISEIFCQSVTLGKLSQL